MERRSFPEIGGMFRGLGIRGTLPFIATNFGLLKILREREREREKKILEAGDFFSSCFQATSVINSHRNYKCDKTAFRRVSMTTDKILLKMKHGRMGHLYQLNSRSIINVLIWTLKSVCVE